MKIVNSTEAQIELLRYLHPERRVSPYLALVPGSEYYFWARRFTHLLDSLSAWLYPINLKNATKLPIIQCVAKLIGVNTDGFLVPKVFKFGTLPEGTFKDFGLSSQVVPLLDSVAGTLPYATMPFPSHDFKTNCLGFLAWDSIHPAIYRGDKYLPHFITCTSTGRLKDVKIQNENWSPSITYEGKEYASFLPSYNYYENQQFQKLLATCNEQKLLVLPLNLPLDNLQKMVGFTNPSWAEVKSLEFFLEESPENLSQYVLIRTDDGKIVTWDEVMKTPKLRLEIEMEDYWLWQEACFTNEALESLNLYWEFGMDYPWIIDKRDNSLVPVFIVED